MIYICNSLLFLLIGCKLNSRGIFTTLIRAFTIILAIVNFVFFLDWLGKNYPDWYPVFGI